ncbi:unnamed protein product [Orchesella dallaii]|uniref:Uncharacterized protein n=1 Tax=Orchesella dallaii TaxID=48710 RepID=A0ABP1PID1_9HEXA
MNRFMQSLFVCGSSFALVFIKTLNGLQDGLDNYVIENANHALSIFCSGLSCEQPDIREYSFKVVTFGLLGWATIFAGNLFEQLARDGILLSALTLGNSANAFRFKARVNDLGPGEVPTIGADIKNDYAWIKRISKHVNSAFNIVFRFFLLSNICMIAVFVDDWFNPHVGKVAKGVKLANVVCVCITFYYANQTAKTVKNGTA